MFPRYSFSDKALLNYWFNETHHLNLTIMDLVDLLEASNKGHEQTDGVAMGSPLGPLRANVFMGSIEETLVHEGKMPSFYKRYVGYPITIMLEKTSAVLNNCHSSVKFTMKTGSTPSFSRTECNYLTELFKLRPKSKPTNTGLLLLYQSHVDMRYRRGLLKTMLDRTRAYRISSCWSFLF